MGGAHPSPSGFQGEVDACLGCLALCHASVSVELQVGRFIVSLDCSEPPNVQSWRSVGERGDESTIKAGQVTAAIRNTFCSLYSLEPFC